MRKVFEIALPDHLVRFAKVLWFQGQDPPYQVTEKHPLGKYILFILNDKRQREPLTTDYPAYLTLDLSDTIAKRSPDLIKLSRIEGFLEESFKRSCIDFVEGATSSGMPRYPAVELFLKSKGIDSDDLKASLYRHVTFKKNEPYKNHAESQKKQTIAERT